MEVLVDTLTPSAAFGRRVAEARKTHSPRLRQQDLADRVKGLGLQMERPRVSEIERGDGAEVRLEEALVIARVLDVAPAFLICGPFAGAVDVAGEAVPSTELRAWVAGDSAPRWFRRGDYIDTARRMFRFYVEEIPPFVREHRESEAREHIEFEKGGGFDTKLKLWTEKAAAAEAAGEPTPPVPETLRRPEWLSVMVTLGVREEES